MGFTSKYEFEDMAYSTADKSGIVTSNVGKMDDNLHTYIEGTCGETIAQYDAAYLESDGKYDKAQADGTQQPCAGLAIEAGVLDDTIRIQRIGPITNAGWSWGTVGAKVYLDASTPGALTATKPTTNVQMIGVVLSATSIFLIGLIHLDDASETTRGVAELATTAECVTGSDTVRTVTPAGLTARLAAPGEIGGTTPNGITLTNEGLHVLDTNASHDLIIKPGSDLTADRILNIATGDAARTVTLSGNPTLDDWFNQAVKVASTPTFKTLDLSGTFTATEYQLDVDCNFNLSSGSGVHCRGASVDYDISYQASEAYYSRGFLLDYAINADGDQTFNNTGYDRVLNLIGHLKENAGTLSELSGIYLDVGSYGPGGADVTATITNMYGIKLVGRKMTSTTISTAYGVHIYGLAGSNVFNIYAADSGAKNYFAGNTGVGTTSPDRLFHAEESSALTNTVQQVARLTHITSGTPANNIGVGLEFEQETAAGNNEVIATIEAICTDVTGASEEGAISLKTMVAGAAATEALRVDSDRTAGNTALLLYDVDNATVERVSVGAADSGGAGFKVLRIPN